MLAGLCNVISYFQADGLYRIFSGSMRRSCISGYCQMAIYFNKKFIRKILQAIRSHSLCLNISEEMITV